MHSQIETASEFFHFFNSFKSLLGVFGHRTLARRQQIRISLVVGASHAAAQLMELSQAEFVGTMHDDRVGVRNVDAGFDNRCAKQHVGALSIEVTHDAFKFPLVHLTMCNADTGFRKKLLETHAGVFNGFDFVMKKVNLTAAL